MMNIEQRISNYEVEAITSSFRIPCSKFDIIDRFVVRYWFTPCTAWHMEISF